MPRAGPRSQCGCGREVRWRAPPWRRTSTLCSAVLPTGTLAWGRFGSTSDRSSICRSTFSICCSSSLINTERSLVDARRSAVSAPSRLRRPISSCSRLFCGRRPSFCASAGAFAQQRVTRARSGRRRRRGFGSPSPGDRRTVRGSRRGIDHAPHCSGGAAATSPGGRFTRAKLPRVSTSVRKAVFPAAGLGTRFLPATKAQPKEMLPLVDKPMIQYGVEEALASGIDNIILVTGRGKNAIEDHFDVNVELETFLEARGKTEQLSRSADLQPDQFRLCPAGRAARPRPRRARHPGARRRRAVRRSSSATM